MKADLTRDTFDATHHFLRVLHQQGRVTLDANPNEQTAILLHFMQALARDLIGPYGAPATGGGFQLGMDGTTLQIGAGNYYVDGILVENDTPCSYAAQPDFTAADDDPLLQALRDKNGQKFWLYLDVWERHISWIEDPRLLDTALGGVDTCSRAKIVWQVKALPAEVEVDANGGRARLAALMKQQQSLNAELAKATAPAKIATLEAKLKAVNEQIAEFTPAAGGAAAPPDDCAAPLTRLSGISNASLAARVDPGQTIEDACTIAPDAQYRGAQNQLYRVEIHRGGNGTSATFKWARDNGSVAAAWLGSDGKALQVSATHGFEAGNWVELSSDARELQGLAGDLVKLSKVDSGALTVDPDSLSNPAALGWSEALGHPKVRRWDQTQIGDASLTEGALPVVESTLDGALWLDLEDGLQISFAQGGTYRVGDYWLIPARTASGGIEWPLDAAGLPQLRAPAGIVHHYAPLGFVHYADGVQFASCRAEFVPLAGWV